MFEKFTEKAIQVIVCAQEETRAMGHNFVGTEQILLGLIKEGTGVGARMLRAWGVDLNQSRIEVEKLIGRGSGFTDVEIPFTAGATRLLHLSWDEAKKVGHSYIGTEHLLLGLITGEEGVALRVLRTLSVDLDKLRSELAPLVKEIPASRPSTAPTSEFLDGLKLMLSSDRSNLESEQFTARLKLMLALFCTPQLDRVLQRFWYETRGRYRELGVEHLFLGLIQDDEGAVVSLLKKHGVDLVRLRMDLEQSLATGSVDQPGSRA